MTTPADFRASLLDLRRQIDSMLSAIGDESLWRPNDPPTPNGGFCLGNWRIVPRFTQNTPAESPEASRVAFNAWWEGTAPMASRFDLHSTPYDVAWQAWKASRAQLNSPSPQWLAQYLQIYVARIG